MSRLSCPPIPWHPPVTPKQCHTNQSRASPQSLSSLASIRVSPTKYLLLESLTPLSSRIKPIPASLAPEIFLQSVSSLNSAGSSPVTAPSQPSVHSPTHIPNSVYQSQDISACYPLLLHDCNQRLMGPLSPASLSLPKPQFATSSKQNLGSKNVRIKVPSSYPQAPCCVPSDQ